MSKKKRGGSMEKKGKNPEADAFEAHDEMENTQAGAEQIEELATEPLEEIKALEDRLRDAERQRDEYLDMAQRMKAEFENFRRRNSAIRSEAWDDGARETIALMLPIIDNLERALDAEKEKTPFRDGVEMVHRQMLEALSKRGVTVIDRVGQPFDPELENAVMQVDGSEGEPGTVSTVLQKGYKTESRVIRHAMVCVVAG